jgi:very-short-patch-repair endonuclease
LTEVDGRRWHTRRSDFERDRERDQRAQMHGFEVTRFSYRQLTHRPDHAREVLAAIGRESAA